MRLLGRRVCSEQELDRRRTSPICEPAALAVIASAGSQSQIPRRCRSRHAPKITDLGRYFKLSGRWGNRRRRLTTWQLRSTPRTSLRRSRVPEPLRLIPRVLLAQLCSLERRVCRGGRDSIDHPPRGRDDVINSAAGALVRALALARTGEMAAPVSLMQANPFDDETQQAGELPIPSWWE